MDLFHQEPVKAQKERGRLDEGDEVPCPHCCMPYIGIVQPSIQVAWRKEVSHECLQKLIDAYRDSLVFLEISAQVGPSMGTAEDDIYPLFSSIISEAAMEAYQRKKAT